ncbi:MAG: segregation/condensation protein A [Deltaproteobacteria bacterium]|nr:segregation/condensation protein A [Deltaproteobacteria bacterium]
MKKRIGALFARVTHSVRRWWTKITSSRQAEVRLRLTAPNHLTNDAPIPNEPTIISKASQERDQHLADLEAARIAQEQARIAQEEADRAEAERLAQEEIKRVEDERLAQQEAERIAKAEAQAAQEQAERLAQQEAERLEAERVAKEEAARIAEAEAKAAEEARKAERPPLVIPNDYVPAAESDHELYQIDVNGFEGPLDLLLFLIRKHALDIFDIPIAFICERYLDCLHTMEELNIDVAAEFLAVSAELLYIKSKLLLPKPVEVDDEEETDPRADLVRRLLEYQKYKDAAGQLAGLTRVGRDTFNRNPENIPKSTELQPLAEVGLFALIEAFDAVLKRQKPELRHQVVLEAVSVRQRVRAFIEVFIERQSIPFEELLADLAMRIDIVVSFLAILEMVKLQLLRIYQSNEGGIYLEARFSTALQANAKLEGLDASFDKKTPKDENERRL